MTGDSLIDSWAFGCVKSTNKGGFAQANFPSIRTRSFLRSPHLRWSCPRYLDCLSWDQPHSKQPRLGWTRSRLALFRPELVQGNNGQPHLIPTILLRQLWLKWHWNKLVHSHLAWDPPTIASQPCLSSHGPAISHKEANALTVWTQLAPTIQTSQHIHPVWACLDPFHSCDSLICALNNAWGRSSYGILNGFKFKIEAALRNASGTELPEVLIRQLWRAVYLRCRCHLIFNFKLSPNAVAVGLQRTLGLWRTASMPTLCARLPSLPGR